MSPTGWPNLSLKPIEVAHHEAQFARFGRFEKSLVELLIEEAAVAERGQGIAQGFVVGLGEVGAQFFDLGDRLVQIPREIAHLGLNLLILVDQRKNDRADLLGLFQQWQIVVGASEGIRIARIGAEMRLEESRDHRQVGGETLLRRVRLVIGAAFVADPGWRSLGRALEFADADAQHAESDQPEDTRFDK
jgi:hypothetical protein